MTKALILGVRYCFILFFALFLNVESFGQLNAEKYISMARGDMQNQNYTLAIQRLNFAIKSNSLKEYQHKLDRLDKINIKINKPDVLMYFYYQRHFLMIQLNLKSFLHKLLMLIQ